MTVNGVMAVTLRYFT